MKNNSLKKSGGLTREQQREAGRLFGKQVSNEKALLLFIVTLLTCAMPMLVGRRLWDAIPEIVETGLIGAEGKDDSMPRSVLVYGIPGLMCVLNTICHGQLWLHQKAEKLPPASSRLIGRWGFPVLSAFFASGCAFQAAGEKMGAFFITVTALALILLMCGGRFFDRTESFSLREGRIIGVCWMAAGLLLMFFVMNSGTVPAYSAIVIVPLLFLPFICAKITKR